MNLHVYGHTLTAEIAWEDESACFVARVKGLPGCTAHGHTEAEAARQIAVAAALHVEQLHAEGRALERKVKPKKRRLYWRKTVLGFALETRQGITVNSVMCLGAAFVTAPPCPRIVVYSESEARAAVEQAWRKAHPGWTLEVVDGKDAA